MLEKEKFEEIFTKHKYSNFKWIDPKKIIVAQWVRLKCQFGCKEFGKSAVCPPNTPTVSECKQFFQEYTNAVIFHFEASVENPEDRFLWTKKINAKLNKLERDVFIAGFQKTFLLYMDTCCLCDECNSDRSLCKHQELARPAAEALSVDVFSTVKQFGFPIQVLSDYSQTMNRYAFLLID
jgi:predicted metal-binding protein